MLKRLIPQPVQEPPNQEHWLDLSTIPVTVEVTSENPSDPVERALLEDHDVGWRAAKPGIQTMRILFDGPQDVERILLCFVETATARTQEFVLRWSNGTGGLKEILRQQWNFSPNAATSEIEDYAVSLRALRLLELTINPDITGANAYASIRRLRLA